MAYLIVLTSDSGVPLFTRKYGDIPTLPFPTVGALNGVHMYSRLRGAELQRAVTPEEKLVWREYLKSLVLILITQNDACSDCHVLNLLDNIFASMVMLVGSNAILRQKKVEKLKRDLMVCYPLIDRLLSQVDPEQHTIGDLTLKADCLLTVDTHILQERMSQFLEICDSLYGCLLIKGKIVVASKDWWSLTAQEIVLICNVVNTLQKAMSREIPIFLPTTCQGVCSFLLFKNIVLSNFKQNNEAFIFSKEFNRLVTLQLLRGIEVCVLCSATPELAILEEKAPKIWTECFDLLKTVSNLSPRNFPRNIDVDRNIMGFILINTENDQSMCSVQPIDDICVMSKLELQKRQEALRTLYKLVVGTHFQANDLDLSNKMKSDKTSATDKSPQQTEIQAQEYYVCTEKNKCYAIQVPSYQFFVIFNHEIPHYALRFTAHKTLKTLTEKKLFPLR